MDSRFVIHRDDAKIAGFKHTVNGRPEDVWCAECAIADGEGLPYNQETELDLPAYEDVEGEIGPILSEMIDQYAAMEGNDPKMTADLSDRHCDECGQSLQPE